MVLFPLPTLLLPFLQDLGWGGVPCFPRTHAQTYLVTPGIEGIQNRPLQNGLPWLVDYFELKAIETLRAPEKLLLLP